MARITAVGIITRPMPKIGRKAQNRRNASPQDRGVESHDRIDPAAEDALDQAADTVPFQDGVGDFLELVEEQPVFVVRQG